MALPQFQFLKDEPLTKGGPNYFDFYHSSIAPALKEILENNTSPHTIGLFGAWGTGKSTIIEMIADSDDLDMPVFVFDAWKYQEDTLRRTFLIQLVAFLRDQDVELPDDILLTLYKSKAQQKAKANPPT